MQSGSQFFKNKKGLQPFIASMLKYTEVLQQEALSADLGEQCSHHGRKCRGNLAVSSLDYGGGGGEKAWGWGS